MFRVGQRVKNVREPGFIGMTGIVAGFDVDPINDECDIVIRADDGGFDSLGRVFFAGDTVDSESKFWEPITPPHEACFDAEFIASLDRLAAKVEEMA